MISYWDWSYTVSEHERDLEILYDLVKKIVLLIRRSDGLQATKYKAVFAVSTRHKQRTYADCRTIDYFYHRSILSWFTMIASLFQQPISGQ